MQRFLLPLILTVWCCIGVVSAHAECSGTCNKPPEGYIVCQAACQYPSDCKVDDDLQPTNYCYYDMTVNTCHNGEYDPCCDPECEGPF